MFVTKKLVSREILRMEKQETRCGKVGTPCPKGPFESVRDRNVSD